MDDKYIDSIFLNALNIRDLGLFKGKIGIVVFLYNYYRYLDKKIYKIFADELLKDLYDEISSNSTVNFEWAAATDPDGDTVSYELRVALDNNMTNLVEQVTSTTTTRTLTLQPGTAYYWTVTAKDAEDSASPSQVFAFYTEGEGVSNYAPFLADLVRPNEEEAVVSGTTSFAPASINSLTC